MNIGILSKVEFSEWAALTVYVRKKSKEIWVCADFSIGLKAALKDYHYPLSSPEEVFNKLNGGKIFLKIDLSEAFLLIPVEENSSKLLCINTHRGLYKFDGLVFGIKVAPAIFQQVMDTMLGDFDSPFAYLDDIAVNICSKWPEVLRFRRPTTGTTIGFLHELIALFGVGDCVVSDNGSQFTSVEFKEFCEIFQIKHITTPQYHPRSNGQAERF